MNRLRLAIGTVSLIVVLGGVTGCATTRQQDYTYTVFRQCAPTGAYLTYVKPDGSFGFESESIYDAHTIKRCMGKAGFTFGN